MKPRGAISTNGEYPNFQALLDAGEQEGLNFLRCVCDRGSVTTIIAPHGGRIEPHTDRIAAAIARDDLNFYRFEGIKSLHKGQTLHITSHYFDDPSCLSLVKKSDFVVAIHGLDRTDDRVDIGGLDCALRDAVYERLRQSGFSASIVTTGTHAARNVNNICNRGRSGRGVQLELAMGMRRNLRGKRLTAFADAIREAINSRRDAPS